MDATQTFEPDRTRLGRKWGYYLLAMRHIVSVLERPVSGKGVEELDRMLKDALLPALKEGSNSQVAFVSDKEGKILFMCSDGNLLNEKEMPLTTIAAQDLLARGVPLEVHKKYEGDQPIELAALGVDSLMVFRLQTQTDCRLVGACNGKNQPIPYLYEDISFLDSMLKVLARGIDLGASAAAAEAKLLAEKAATIDSALNNYRWARLRGEWNYLSSASRVLAQRRLGEKAILRSFGSVFDNITLDDLITDFLDSELSKAVHSIPIEAPTPNKVLDELLALCHYDDSSKDFSVQLSVTSEPRKVEINSRPHLAMARICLFGGYFKSKNLPAEINSQLKTDGISKTPKTKQSSLASRKSLELFELSNSPFTRVPKCTATIDAQTFIGEDQLDCFRTRWQQIHYLANEGFQLTPQDRVTKINEIYNEIWEGTALTIKRYLQEQPEKYLSIDSDWTAAWMVGNVLLSKNLRDHYGLVASGKNVSQEVNPMTKMRYALYLSIIVLHVLHCARHQLRLKAFAEDKQTEFERPPLADIPMGLLISRTRAQIYVLSEYAYHEIGVPRELYIYEKLVHQLGIELPLHTASNFYRDHLYHVMDVCLLGELLLRSTMSGEKSNSPTFAEHIGRSFEAIGDVSVLKNWYVAALCHDLGYVVELANKFLSPLKKVNGDGLDAFVDRALDGIRLGKVDLDNAIRNAKPPPDIDLARVDQTDHSIVGWLHLLKLLDDVAYPINMLKQALLAILRHNLHYQKVSVKQEPLSMLLKLCDHVQEWGRPRIGPDPLAQSIIEAMRFNELPHLKQKIRVHELHISGLSQVNPKRDTDSCKSCARLSGMCDAMCLRYRTQIDATTGLSFTLPHIDSREGDFEPGISWLLFCRDLQCLDFSGSGINFKIEIVLEHTPPRLWTILPWHLPEMDLLEEYANTQPEAAYLSEWLGYARHRSPDCKGISYELHEKEKERFTIDLTELNHPLRRGLPDHIWKGYFKWKWRWLGQKFLSANFGPSWPEVEEEVPSPMKTTTG